MPSSGTPVEALHRFMESFDRKDWARMRELLEPIIRVDYSDLRGGGATELTADAYVRLRADALQHLATAHRLSDIEVVTLEGSTASVRARCRIDRSDGARYFNSDAAYTFALTARAGSWKISAIEQRILRNEGDPTIHKGVRTGHGT